MTFQQHSSDCRRASRAAPAGQRRAPEPLRCSADLDWLDFWKPWLALAARRGAHKLDRKYDFPLATCERFVISLNLSASVFAPASFSLPPILLACHHYCYCLSV